MTVVKVIGSINEHDVICVQRSPDIWDCDPGDTPDGRYVAEFWAVDEAGNIGYRLAILYIYDGKCVKIEWIEDDINVKYINDNFDICVLKDSFDLFYVGMSFPIFIEYIDDGFDLTIIRCEGGAK